MEEADRRRITTNLETLVQLVRLDERLWEQLVRRGLLTPDGQERVRAAAQPRDRTRLLLTEATRRGPRAFQQLVVSLAETGQLEAARLLKPDLSAQDLLSTAPAPASGPVPTSAPHRPPAQPPQILPEAQEGEGRLKILVKPATKYRGPPEDDRAYKMNSTPRGYALIINNIHFRDTELHDHRFGSEVDGDNLKSLLQQLGFVVREEKDLDRRAMETTISQFARQQVHAAADCCVLAVLTHGQENVLFGVDSRPLSVEQVIRMFSHDGAPHLYGKPKWLIFQACRGGAFNLQTQPPLPILMPSNTLSTDGRPQTHEYEQQLSLGEVSDIFITYSTIPGYVSLRDTDRGTWLVDVICQVFTERACLDSLTELHRRVQQTMSLMVTDKNHKQTIETAQRGWRYRLYFNPGL